jgi:Ca2+-transporting ATPase
VHILWVNLITDTLPALSLGMEPGDPAVLDEPPRPPTESLFARGGGFTVVGNGLLIGLVTLFAYLWALRLHPDSLIHARTVAFAVLSLTQLFHAFNLRHPVRSVFGVCPLGNPFLIGALLIGILLQVLVISIAPLAAVFRVSALSIADWLTVLLLGLFPILINEIFKIFRRLRS